MTTIAQNYTGQVNLSCPAGYFVIAASCDAGSAKGIVINGASPASPFGPYASYLTPNVTAATGVHCGLPNSWQEDQALLRCAK